MQEHELSPVKREFLALFMAAPVAERRAVMQLLMLWKNGAGPDKAAADVWLHNKVAEIKARRRQDAVELREKRRERMAEILPVVLERLDKKYAADGDPDHDDAS